MVVIATVVVDEVPATELKIGNSLGAGVPARATIVNSATPGATMDIPPVLYATDAEIVFRVAIKAVTGDVELAGSVLSKVN